MKSIVDRVTRKLNYVMSYRSAELDEKDLMMPNEYGYSGTQFITMSRVFDICSFRNGGELNWHTEFYEHESSRRLSMEQKREMNSSFIQFISQMDNEGLDLVRHPLICNRDPITLLNGTHRLSYYILSNEKKTIKLELRYDEIYFPIKGEEWLRKIGISEGKIRKLKTGLDQYNSKIPYRIIFAVNDFLEKSHIDEIKNKLQGKIEDITFIDKSIFPYNKKWERVVTKATFSYVYLYTITLLCQSLYWCDKDKIIKSRIIDVLKNEVSRKEKKIIIIAHTVNESKKIMEKLYV